MLCGTIYYVRIVDACCTTIYQLNDYRKATVVRLHGSKKSIIKLKLCGPSVHRTSDHLIFKRN